MQENIEELKADTIQSFIKALFEKTNEEAAKMCLLWLFGYEIGKAKALGKEHEKRLLTDITEMLKSKESDITKTIEYIVKENHEASIV